MGAADVSPDAVSRRNGIGDKAGITLSDAIEEGQRVVGFAAQQRPASGKKFAIHG
jgi:hypothetical protein